MIATTAIILQNWQRSVHTHTKKQMAHQIINIPNVIIYIK